MCKGTINECLNCPYPDCIKDFKPQIRTEKVKEYHREYQRKLCQERKNANLCVRCGRPKHRENLNHCDWCIKQISSYKSQQSYAKEEASQNNLCLHCFKKPRYQDYKVCKECYEQIVECGKKGRMVQHEKQGARL